MHNLRGSSLEDCFVLFPSGIPPLRIIVFCFGSLPGFWKHQREKPNKIFQKTIRPPVNRGKQKVERVRRPSPICNWLTFSFGPVRAHTYGIAGHRIKLLALSSYNIDERCSLVYQIGAESLSRRSLVNNQGLTLNILDTRNLT